MQKKCLPTLIFLAIASFVLASNPAADMELLGKKPVIEYISVSPNPAYSGLDELTIHIEYEDADGDLVQDGESAKDNVFVRDMRTGKTYMYRVTPGMEYGYGNTGGNAGEIMIMLQEPKITAPMSNEQRVDWEIYVEDSNGLRSNVVRTHEVLLKRYDTRF